MKLFDATRIPMLTRALDVYALRQRVISSNVANIGTDGYKAQRVRFEEELSGAARGSSLRGTVTHADHLAIGGGDAGAVRPSVGAANEDGTADGASGVNDVDIDREMAEMAKNQIRFKFAARLIGDGFRGIQKSIRGTV
jgi:flagellar basal-body rod protein FlgB